jgi:bifunctional DNase/RNase
MELDNENLKNEDLIPVRILGIYPYGDPNDPRQLLEGFLVFLKGREDKVVPISIGRFEGQALALALRKVPSSRPLPYDLLKDLLEKMNGEVKQLVIHTLKKRVFHAYLLIQAQERELMLDCRPSDGMILATLTGVSIYISPQIVEEAGRELNGLLENSDLSEESLLLESDDDPLAGLREAEPQEEEEMSELDKLKAQLNQLVAEEAYEEAAKVRDLISRMVRQST